jgi:tripartite ATP-independent transporter DctM subunit
MNLTLIGLLGVCVLVVLILLGVNIGVSMAAVGFVGFALIVDFPTAFAMFRTIPFTQSSGYALTVVPLFILMGEFAFASGLSSGLYNAADKWLSRVKGGLAVTSIVACAGFSAICGSTAATAATMGNIALPEMKKADYRASLSTGSLAAGGTLGILIPPSTAFVVYGIATEQSIGRLFAAGIIPGILLALCYIFTVMILCKRNPSLAPTSDRTFTWSEKFRSLIGVGPVCVLFLAVIGGMFAGIFTANEAATVGAVIGAGLMAVRGKLTVRSLFTCVMNSIKTTAMIFQIFICAYVFNYFLTVTMLPHALARFIAGLDVSRYVVMAIILLIFLGLGCIMDSMAMVLLTIPIFLPIVLSLGFDPIWFGVIMVMVMEQGLMTPPVGMNVYIIAGVAKDVPMTEIFKGVLPFVVALFVAVIIIIIFPQLALFLPSVFYG